MAFIEFVRGVPLITVLFMASVMLPLFVPNALLRTSSSARYRRDAVCFRLHGGGGARRPAPPSRAVNTRRRGRWVCILAPMGLVILPQALRFTMPNIVNTFIALFKDTTLVFVVGIFDFLRTIEAARADPKWASRECLGHRLRLRRGLLLHLLLWHVALRTPDGSAAFARRPALRDCDGRSRTATEGNDAAPEVAVEIIGLHKWYGEFHVLRDINLKVGRGERIVICGPSGGGKSTLLRCINRLEDWQQAVSSSTATS